MPTLLAQNLKQGTIKCGTCLGREPKTKPWHGFEVLGLTLTWVHSPFPDKSGPTKARQRCFIDRIAKNRKTEKQKNSAPAWLGVKGRCFSGSLPVPVYT